MNIKKENALAGIDMVIAVIAIILFTTLILTLMSTNATKNLKIATETMAMIYMTEILENIGIADFEDVVQENAETFIPSAALERYDSIEIQVIDEVEGVEEEKGDLFKKVCVTIKYQIQNKTYLCSMERLKIKE